MIWHHTAAFADIFNDMQVYVYDVDGSVVGEKSIPVYLAPKEKVVAALQKGNWDTDGSIVFENYLPSISIVWNGISLDRERMRGQRDSRRLYVELDCEEDPCSTEIIHTDFQTVPYKLNFEVTLWAKYMDDMAQMLENILPFFHPEAYTSFYEKGIQSERKVKIELESTNLNFVYELNQPDRRVLQSNLNFNMECNFYKPENPITKPIKRLYVDIADVQSPTSAYGDTVMIEASGGGCFIDIDSDLRWFIKQFNQENEIYASQRFNETQGLAPQPRTEEYPSLSTEEIEDGFKRDPVYDPNAAEYKFLKANAGQNVYTVIDNSVTAGDTILAQVYNPYREKVIFVQSIAVSNGQFTLSLSEVPPVEGYDIVWRKV